VSRKSEYDAAYFTLLRAREEHADLLRYREFLERESARLAAFADETRARSAALARRVRRPVEGTQRPLLEAVGRHRTTLIEELERSGDRVAAAEAFVEECEREVATLRG
jgi:hypothetical protein